MTFEIYATLQSLVKHLLKKFFEQETLVFNPVSLIYSLN
jgi:hypothetical protein